MQPEVMRVKSLRGKLVKVNKKSRGKFPLPTATPGSEGLVVAAWVSYGGTEKLTILADDMSTVCTSLKCIEVCESKDEEKWAEIKAEYDRRNSIPVIVKCLNVGKKAYRLESLNKKVFFLKHGGKPDRKKGEHFSVNVPVWIAEKEGIIILD
tara:strand:+ start:359 stop:814 length:456 start_codon:yes stop_codon:yes gene_type:complete